VKPYIHVKSEEVTESVRSCVKRSVLRIGS
jgi:hypothetical protein